MTENFVGESVGKDSPQNLDKTENVKPPPLLLAPSDTKKIDNSRGKTATVYPFTEFQNAEVDSLDSF
jgi:hypothetical protein